MATAVLFIILSCLYTVVSGDAILKINMIQYVVDGKDFEGDSCDRRITLNKQCDPMFKFCVDDVDGLPTNFDICDIVGYPETDHYQGLDTVVFAIGGYLRGGQVPNPIEVTLREYQGFQLKVKVRDDDTGHSGHDLVDRFSWVYEVSPDKSRAVSRWREKTIYGTRPYGTPSQLRVSVLLYCKDNYYGYGCDVYCVAADNQADGHYTCDPVTGDIICRPQWEDKSEKCLIWRDDCSASPCQHGATCVDLYAMYSCTCPPGYTGNDCQTDIYECASSPCQNGGSCVDGVDRYACLCPGSYSGPNCEHSNSACDGTLNCLNGGRCVKDSGQQACFCPPQYAGLTCQVDICQLLDCQNGGVCLAGTCRCIGSYMGDQCQIDMCAGVTCRNGGTCHRGKCYCTSQFLGSSCQGSQACQDEPCLHAGTCYDNDSGGYICRCLPQYNGTNCENTVRPEWDRVKDTQPNDGAAVAPIKQGPQPWIIILIAVIALLIAVIVIVAAMYFRYKRRQLKLAKASQTSGGGVLVGSSGATQTPNAYINPVFTESVEREVRGPLPSVANQVRVYDNMSQTSGPPPYRQTSADPGPVYKPPILTEEHGAVGVTRTEPNLYDNPRNISGPYGVTSTTREDFPPDQWTPTKKSPQNQSGNVSSGSGGGGNKSFLHTGPKKPVFAAAADEDADPYSRPLTEAQRSNMVNSILDKDKD